MRGDKKFTEYESEDEVIADGEESIDGSHRSIETLKIMGSKLKHKYKSCSALALSVAFLATIPAIRG